MKNEELLFERNYEYSFVPKIKRQLKLSRDKQLIYKIKQMKNRSVGLGGFQEIFLLEYNCFTMLY